MKSQKEIVEKSLRSAKASMEAEGVQIDDKLYSSIKDKHLNNNNSTNKKDKSN